MGRHDMIKENIYLDDWKVNVIFIKNKQDIEEVIETLWNLGCSINQVKDVYENIINEKYDIGFTYSNLKIKQSVLLIGLQSNKFQLINTIAHESRHLQQHIAIVKGLDQNGESVCYLLGKIVQYIYEICVKNKII